MANEGLAWNPGDPYGDWHPGMGTVASELKNIAKTKQFEEIGGNNLH